MKHKVSNLDGVLLELAFAIANGPWFGNVEPAIFNGVCRVVHDPCGWPGACPRWADFRPFNLQDKGFDNPGRDSVRYGLQWEGDAGEPLKQAMRDYIASRLGDEVELSNEQAGAA
jgi:hypothetical protein